MIVEASTTEIAFWGALAAIGITLLIELARRKRIVASVALLWGLTGLTALAGRGPYFGPARFSGVATGLAFGAVFLAGFAGAAGGQNRIRRTAHLRTGGRPLPQPLLLAVVLGLAVAGAWLRYGSDIPLLSSELDDVRSVARQRNSDGQLLSGTLSLFSILGAWISLTLGIEGKRRSLLTWGFFVSFCGLSFLGGSRNALLLSVTVPLVASSLRSTAAGAGGGRRLSTITPVRRYLATSFAVWLALLALTAFAGFRTSADGVGPLGSAFKAANSGVLERGVNVTVLNLGAQYETLGRLLDEAERSTTLPAGGSYGASSYPVLPLLFGGPEEPFVTMTARLSSPHYQTVAGLAGRMVVDFGVEWGILASAGVGLLLGRLFRRSGIKRSFEGDLQAALVVYLVAFSMYDFLPLTGPAALILFLLVEVLERAVPMTSKQNKAGRQILAPSP